MFIGIELLRGLDHAHRALGTDGQPLQIIHRDVTPGNVMVSFGGAVKLADFGIARFTSRSQQKTTTGFVKGKVAYMPPEQVEARPITPATDVFSAALVISTLLMGKHPLEHASEAELLDRMRAGDIPLPGSAVVGIPKALDAIIAAALKPRIGERTQTAQAFLEQLEGFVLDEHVRTGPGPTSLFLHEVCKEQLAKRELARASGEHVAAVATVTPTPLAGASPLVATPRPDVAILATHQVPAKPAASRGRRMLVLAPNALVAAGGIGTAGWLGRERALLASLRNDCEGNWRVVSMQSVAGGIPGVAKAGELRVIVRENAEHGVRLSFKEGGEETISIPLDLTRDGATLIGRYNGGPVKFWAGDASPIGGAERMNVRVRLRPLGTVLDLDFAMFGEGLASREWSVTAAASP